MFRLLVPHATAAMGEPPYARQSFLGVSGPTACASAAAEALERRSKIAGLRALKAVALHAHAAALVQETLARRGQRVPRLDRRPVGLDRPAAVLVAPGRALGRTRKLQTAVPDGMKRCSGSAPIQPTNSTRLTVPLTCSMTLTSCTYSYPLSQPQRLASVTIPLALNKGYGVL